MRFKLAPLEERIVLSADNPGLTEQEVETGLTVLLNSSQTESYTSTLGGAQGWDRPFNVAVDGYGFENFGLPPPKGYDFPEPYVSTEDMIKYFGHDAVCNSNGNSESCTLTPQAKHFADIVLTPGGKGGHCFGMAVTSLRFFDGLDNLDEFSSSAEYTYDLKKTNSKVLENINYYFLEQKIHPISGLIQYYTTLSLSESLSLLHNSFSSVRVEGVFDKNNPFTLYNLGILSSEGGHAITPYGIEKQSSSTYHIKVYDNNFPGDTDRFVEINLNSDPTTPDTDTWKYNLGSKSNPLPWEGQSIASQKNVWENSYPLTLFPLALSEISPLTPTFKSPQSGGSETSLLSFETDRDLNVYFGESSEYTTHTAFTGGFDNDGALIEFEDYFSLSQNHAHTITLDAVNFEETIPSSISKFGQGTNISIENIFHDPKQMDTFKISKDGETYHYTTADEENIDVRLSFETEEEDFGIQLNDLSTGNGATLTIDVDKQNGTLVFGNSEGEVNISELSITRASNDFYSSQTAQLTSLDGYSYGFLHFEDWKGHGTSLFLGLKNNLDESYFSNWLEIGPNSQVINLASQGASSYEQNTTPWTSVENTLKPLTFELASSVLKKEHFIPNPEANKTLDMNITLSPKSYDEAIENLKEIKL